MPRMGAESGHHYDRRLPTSLVRTLVNAGIAQGERHRS
jgi:hypothetical protein